MESDRRHEIAWPTCSPEVDAMVREIIARVADRWTMLVLEALEEHGRLRFTRLSELVHGVSQKMLTKTVRQMESDGLVTRTVYPVVPPRVEYELTPLGLSLSEVFCGVWGWVQEHHAEVEAARQAFAGRSTGLSERTGFPQGEMAVTEQ